MSYIGIRCSNSDITYVVLSGTRSTPIVEVKRNLPFPKNYSHAETLNWLLLELREIFSKFDVDNIAIKDTEPMARKGTIFGIRSQFEATIYIAAWNLGITNIIKRVNPTIAKNLGVKGRAKYLKTSLDTSCFPDYDNENQKTRDAILVVWSHMN